MLVQIVQTVNVHHIHYTEDCVSQRKLYVIFFWAFKSLVCFQFRSLEFITVQDYMSEQVVCGPQRI